MKVGKSRPSTGLYGKKVGLRTKSFDRIRLRKGR